MVPRHCWEPAKRQLFEDTLVTLALLGAEAPRFAMEAVTIAVARTIEAEPLLAPVLGDVAPDSLAAVVMAFLNCGAIDRGARGEAQRYRRGLADKLPREFLRFVERVPGTLDAPRAAALAVQGRRARSEPQREHGMAEAEPAATRPVTGPLRTVELIRGRAAVAVLGQSELDPSGLAAEVRRRFGSADVGRRAGARAADRGRRAVRASRAQLPRLNPRHVVLRGEHEADVNIAQRTAGPVP